MKEKVIILGAAGRDMHNFNMFFRDNSNYNVKAFTAAQITGIADRRYPKELAGKLYPRGIPIFPEEQLPKLIKRFNAGVVVLAYSDLPHEEVMHKASIVNACGADFWLMGTQHTQLKSKKKVIAVCAVRTGCGKSQTTQRICDILRKRHKKFVVVRHPMPYGDLRKQIWQRYEKYEDLDKYNCTVEEREEYEPHIEQRNILYAGVDYEKILQHAEKEANIIVWDGGNNDTPFYKPDLLITLTDPHRPEHEVTYYPGETNLRMADAVMINKEKTAKKEDIETVRENIKSRNPKALIIDAHSVITVKNPEWITKKRVIVVEDGPTLTHGGMAYGAGLLAAKKYHAEVVDPRKYAVGSIKETFKKFPHVKKVIPAMGYSEQQLKELQKTINNAKCDTVIDASPVDLKRLIHINKPITEVNYEVKVIKKPTIEAVLRKFKFI